MFSLADNPKVLVKPSSEGQLPKSKECLKGSVPASVLVDPVAQVRSIIAAESEKCLNSMKELLAKQGLNKENSHYGSRPNGQAWTGNANDQQGN